MQALWAAPPLHKVVAIAVLDDPPTVYTGGSDGAIVWWKLSSPPSSSQLEIWPVAMLCGHAAAVADLEICTPGKDYKVTQSLTDKNIITEVSQVLISACVDGVLCTWNSLSGHCKRRRKLPPWVGSPSVLSSLAKSRRYVCIACTCANSGQVQRSHTDEIDEGKEAGKSIKESTLERETSLKKMSKGAIVIVDSLTLDILKIIFHGLLSIGPVKSMVVAPDIVSENSKLVIASDLYGRIQIFTLNEENNMISEAGNDLEKGDQTYLASLGSTNVVLDEVNDVSIASDGKLVLLVSRNQWSIKSTLQGSILIDESCVNGLLCRSSTSDQTFLAGGMFLTNDGYECDEVKVTDKKDSMLTNVVIWNNQGAAIVYAILQSGQSSYAVSLFQLPPISSVNEGDLHVKFSQMHGFLIRIEFMKSDFELSMFQEPHITVWSPSHASSRFQDQGHLHSQSKIGITETISHEPQVAVLLGKGGLWGDWLKTSCLSYTDISTRYNYLGEIDALEEKPGSKKLEADNAEYLKTSCLSYADISTRYNYQGEIDALEEKPESKKLEADNAEYLSCLWRPTSSVDCLKGNNALLVERGKIVTSSMTLSGNSSIPFALIYGFCSGEIKLVKLEYIGPILYAKEDGLQQKNDASVALQSFTGHTGPILCLAAHNMVVTSKEHRSRQILVSGSMDCTVRVWDLEDGSVLSIMHHHVAPVRQILLPPPGTYRPWVDCFLTVADDTCVALSSLETLKVERMFPGHPSYPKMVVWDGVRGYIACLCVQFTTHAGHNDVLYVWDVKSGARERILRGAAAHSMFDNFLRCIHVNASASKVLGGSTSASSLLFHSGENSNHYHDSTVKLDMDGLTSVGSETSGAMGSAAKSVNLATKKSVGNIEKSKMVNTKVAPAASSFRDAIDSSYVNQSSSQQVPKRRMQPIKGTCPFPGVAALQFDLPLLMVPSLGHLPISESHEKKSQQSGLSEEALPMPNMRSQSPKKTNCTTPHKDSPTAISDSAHYQNWSEENTWLGTTEGHLLRLSLSFLHLWGTDDELDKLLAEEMNISKPDHFGVAAGLLGDRGSLTLFLPGWRATFELWKSSSEFCAMRLLMMVSLTQRIITLSRSSSAATSALAAFYMRGFVEKFPDVKPPSLELYACFWQDPSEHIRMAARSLFHCAAARAIPTLLRCERLLPTFSSSSRSYTQTQPISKDEGLSCNDNPDSKLDSKMGQGSQLELSEISSWLDLDEVQDWSTMIGGTDQDANASRIIVGAALAVWYPSLVKSGLAVAVAPELVKLVMAVNGRHSATAAELLAEGMESTWQSQTASDIPHLIGDVFLLIECLSGGVSAKTGSIQNPVMAMTIRETLTGILLPSLGKADVLGFLHVVENQIWTTGSDSPVHLVSLMTLVRIVRSAPKAVVPYLEKVINYILQTIDTGNSVLRKFCLQSSMAVLREMARAFPMVALNQSYTRLAVGDAVGDIRTLSIQVYDLQSVTKLKILDASGPPGLASLLSGDIAMSTTEGISALCFSPDGEGLVAFSHHGLMIRWWSLEAAWWEKLSRSTVAVQCTKLILVPPSADISPPDETHNHERGMADGHTKTTAQRIELSYRLEWKPGKKVLLLQHGKEFGTFQL